MKAQSHLLYGFEGNDRDVCRLLLDLATLAKNNGFQQDVFGEVDSMPLLAFSRPADVDGAPAIYISAGIHGDEPAGPLAIASLFHEEFFTRNFAWYLCPLLNPAGLLINRRENGNGCDLNRDYKGTRTSEVRAHKDWLERQPLFGLTLGLHEDWESIGFYLYEVNTAGDASLALRVIEEVASECPIDHSDEVDGWSAIGGVISPAADSLDRDDWPEALFLIANKTNLNYTFESPSTFPLTVRVQALVRACKAAISALSCDS